MLITLPRERTGPEAGNLFPEIYKKKTSTKLNFFQLSKEKLLPTNLLPVTCDSLHDARFTLADPTPRLCPDAVGSANVNGFPTRNQLSGPHREAIGSRTCTTQLRVVINKTPSPYQPGSRTILYDSLVPTDANVRIARHLANVNGVPTRHRMVSSRFSSDYIGGQSGHRIS